MNCTKLIFAFLLLVYTNANRICFAQPNDPRGRAARLNNVNSSGIINHISSVSCSFYKPTDADFQTQFKAITGTVTLLPQQSPRVLRSTLAMLSDDRISELRIQLIGRRDALENQQTSELQSSNFSGNFSTLQTVNASEIKLFRAYAWRNYSQADLRERERLCEERIRILMTRAVNNALAKKSFDDFERNFQIITDEVSPGRKAPHIHPKDLENMQKEAVLNFERRFAEGHTDSRNVDKALKENAKKINAIDKRYPINRDSVFYREFITAQSFSPGDQIKKLRFRIVQANITSDVFLLNVTSAPKFLLCFAQGGACGVPLGCDAGLNENIAVTVDQQVCQSMGRSSALFSTNTAPRGCNDMCCSDCTNFMELLAKSLVSHGLANKITGIRNDGNSTCNVASSENGINNDIVIGWWKNTREEWLCHGDIMFNDLIENFRNNGNTHLILLGQSHGGRKFTDMINSDNWINSIDIDLFVLWDATDLSGAVRSVGSKPAFVLNFFQKNGLSPEPFQQGDHIDEANEEYDFSGCLSHYAIARSVFVHEKTEEVMSRIIIEKRNNARPGSD